MRYEDFKAAWDKALHTSRLPLLGQGEEALELGSLDRQCRVFVEPLGGQDADPFHVTATLSFRWRALLTARSATTEEDVLTELLGHEPALDAKTSRPWLRVDLVLRASAPFGRPLAMPGKAAWAAWVRELLARLESIEPIVPGESVREGDAGRLEILAYQGEPEVKAVCDAQGDLKLQAVELSAWQAIELPRQWDDSGREADEDPGRQLSEMFTRVKAALHAWMEVMEHLTRPQTARR